MEFGTRITRPDTVIVAGLDPGYPEFRLDYSCAVLQNQGRRNKPGDDDSEVIQFFRISPQLASASSESCRGAVSAQSVSGVG